MFADKLSFTATCLGLCLSLKGPAEEFNLGCGFRIEGSDLMRLFMNVGKIILELLLANLTVIGVRGGNFEFLRGEG